MINLLPTAYAESIRYGRQNSVLRLWLIGAASAVAGLMLILAGGWLYINRQANALQKNIDASNQQLKAQNLAQVQKDAKEITGDIKVINQVLGTEVRFSDLIQAIGQDTPKGTILESLSLSKVTGALNLSADSTDYSTAARVAANLSDPKNGLFSEVDIISVTCGTTNSTTYPCNVTLKALFSPAAKTKFLSIPKQDHS